MRERYHFESTLEYFLNQEVTVETMAGPVKGRLASSEEGGRLLVVADLRPIIVNQWFMIWR